MTLSRTLSYLMRHLQHVSEHGPATGMTAKNLAIVWAPNLLRSLEESITGLASPTSLGGSHNLQDVAAQVSVRAWDPGNEYSSIGLIFINIL